MKEPSGKKIIPPEVLLQGYSQGIFPMSETRDSDDVDWYAARRRGIIPMERFRVSSNVERIIRQSRFECRVDTCFRDVIKACADRPTTWISDVILDSYEVLHHAGYAHSVEMFDEGGELAGGLYGVALGAAFFGESMFKRQKEADKVALWHCHRILKEGGFELWETQYYTDHLSRFGCIEISALRYSKLLNEAIRKEAVFGS